MRIMEDETYHETGQEYRSLRNTGGAAASPENKLTVRKLERHNQSYANTHNNDGALSTSRSNHTYNNRNSNMQNDNTSPRMQSLFPAASVLATARSNRLTSHPHHSTTGNTYARSEMSNMSVAESVISRATARKGKF